MRIGFVTAYYPPYAVGGAEVSTFALADALAARGHSVTILAPRLGDERPAAGLPVATLDVGLRLEKPGHALRPRAFDRVGVQARFAAFVRRHAAKLDLVHCQGFPLLPVAYVGARLAGTPIVATIRDLGGICPISVSLLDQPRVPTDCGVRKLERVCIPQYVDLYGGSRLRISASAPVRFVTARGRSRLLRRCDAVVSVSEDLAALYADADLVSRKHVSVVPNVASLVEGGRGQGEPRDYALYAGKVSPGKGIQYLLSSTEAVRRAVPDFRLLVAGYADSRWTTQLATAEGVQYAGRVDHRVLARLYAGARFAVVPSIWPEPLPRAALEAAFAGVAVVASRAGGLPEVVVDGETGVLVPPRDAGALADAMVDLWRDPGRAAKLGEAGRRLVRDRFSPERIGRETEALYESVVASAT